MSAEPQSGVRHNISFIVALIMNQGQVFRERVEKGKFYGDKGVLSSCSVATLLIAYVISIFAGAAIVSSVLIWPFGTSLFYTVSVLLSLGVSTPTIDPTIRNAQTGYIISIFLVAVSLVLFVLSLTMFFDYNISFIT